MVVIKWIREVADGRLLRGKIDTIDGNVKKVARGRGTIFVLVLPTMNIAFSREVGHLRYFIRRILWRLNPPSEMLLATGLSFPTPKEKDFASDVFVTRCNVDWNSEYILAAALSAFDEKGDLLDVGAHIGYYSLLLRPLVRKAWSFEPDERNHPYLKRALADDEGIEIVAKAVVDFDGRISFADNGESSVSHVDISDNLTKNTVCAITLDTFVAEQKITVSAIKMDIEGFEILALKGAEKTFQESEPIALIEFNQEEGRPNTWDGLQAFANAVNYRIFAVTRKKKNWMTYQYSFDEHEASALAGLSTKMLFLIPQSKKDWFENLSRELGVWETKGLGPASVKSMLAKYSCK